VADKNTQHSDEYLRMLGWRGIIPEYGDKVCSECGGSGVKGYGDTTTWRGGYGGQQITTDVCDQCWGSGKQNKPGVDLRKLFSKLRTLSEDKKST
jgi:DnaJ-class molecular chaperone